MLPLIIQGLLLIAFAVFAYFSLVRSSLSLAPWVPTRSKDFARVQSIICLKPGQKLYEIGCGDARVAISIAKRFPEALVVGVEISPLMYCIACARTFFSGVKNLRIQCADALKMNLRDADVVYVYALPKTVNQTLMPKLRSELKRGSVLISYSFSINDEGVVVHSIPGEANIYVLMMT